MKTYNYVVATYINLDEKTFSVTARDPELSQCEVISNDDGSYALYYNDSYWPIQARNLSVNEAKQFKAMLIRMYSFNLKYTQISAEVNTL